MSATLLLPSAGAANDPAELARVIRSTHWISYAPTHYYPSESPPVLPSAEDLRSDLQVVRNAGFDGVITYGADVELIPEVAQSLGFRHLMLGIWDPLSARERASVVKAIHDHGSLIFAIVVGNEGLTSGRYDLDTLCASMDQIQRDTGKPVTTTETLDWILSEPRIAECSSFLSVNAHPFFSGKKFPDQAVQWTVQAWDAVRARYPQKLVLFKEVGLPSAGDSELSEEAQKEYYLVLAKTPVSFSYFEAFDATSRFKRGLIEESWGLWKADRTPKRIVGALSWK